MNTVEALAEARRRWGKACYVRETHGSSGGPSYDVYTSIGRQLTWSRVSWEAAFSDADRKETNHAS